MPAGGGLLDRGRDCWGPIFHTRNLRTERSWRKNIMRHACPATRPDKNTWAEFYTVSLLANKFVAGETMKISSRATGGMCSQCDMAAVDGDRPKFPLCIGWRETYDWASPSLALGFRRQRP